MFFINELPINHEPSLNYIAKAWAENELIDDDICVTEERLEYEVDMAWSCLEDMLSFEGLKMTTEWWDRKREVN
jgi:hypothetical protein|tara:strand:- start:593 stop:814 length:222 start_codon:yes stop_codon:yes gene_type:complete